MGNTDQDKVNASVHSENSVVSVSVGESNSSSSRPSANGVPEGGGGGLFQKHSKYGNNVTYGNSSGSGVNAQIQQRNSSKYGTIATGEVEKREVSMEAAFHQLQFISITILMMIHPARFDVH